MDAVKGTLEGKVALVTGAGSGIGEASARLLASAGARVGVLTHTPKEGKAVARSIEEGGGEAMFLSADVTDEAQMKSAVRSLEEKWQRLDFVVVNAGINGVWAGLEQLTFSDWRKTMSVNLDGAFLTIKHTLPLLQREGGAVVIVSSVNGTRMFSNSGATAYSVSKAGQVALARMLALELAPQRIRVNTICPGSIDTAIDENTDRRELEKVQIPMKFPRGQIPLTGGKPGSSEQVAELVWFLCSDLSRHITGAEVFIDGAQSLLRG